MKKIIRLCTVVIMVLLVIIIWKDLSDRKQTMISYENLANEVTAPAKEQKLPEIYEEVIQQDDENVHNWFQDYGILVDFLSLETVNEDIIGWIDFDLLEISYPILQGATNEEYLRTDFQGKSATAGSIFLDSMNSRDFQDYHLIIYGHNMRNGSMFGQLKKYKEESFYSGNEYFTIYTKKGIYRYQIFSCHDTDAYGTVYTVGFLPGEQYSNFVTELKNAAMYEYGVDVNQHDHIVTLSTCTADNRNRFVIHAKLIDTIEIEQ